ncbi:hypothetical protein [Effusibacillus lacus]|uniref:ABC transporter substrate-binding protein n=1 Tax=Effusibacillus lacus TaxID=1348429 RepID=A0A292YSA1_9BACL|nr:hypothetical protein [Effusibacillus lacus]TCS76261.1 hypothetical protein EDD64_10325 [Effusibacillus lacus]GAX91809.1 hypothetical protein EFBL_3500 [Effusibacillus lacus]
MKRTLPIGSLSFFLAGTLLVSGCHAPDLSAMKPSKSKLAVGIVGSKNLSGSKEILDYTTQVLSRSSVVFDIRPADEPQTAQEALKGLASNEKIDLIVTESQYAPIVMELASQYNQKKFGLVGHSAQTAAKSVRVDHVNREHQSFVAGYMMAASAPKEPVGVVLSAPRSADSPEWKGLLEGIHYAGSSAIPTVVTLEEAMGVDGLIRLKSLPTRYLLVMDPVNDSQLARLHESGKGLFLLHDVNRTYPSVIARPAPIFAAGVQEQVQSLLNNSWQDNISVPVMGNSFFEIMRPDTIPANVIELKNQVETGLRNRTLEPGKYINPPKQE